MLPSMSKDTSLLKYISLAAKLHSFPTSQIQTPLYYGKVALSTKLHSIPPSEIQHHSWSHRYHTSYITSLCATDTSPLETLLFLVPTTPKFIYIPYFYNTNTSVIWTVRSVSLVPVRGKLKHSYEYLNAKRLPVSGFKPDDLARVAIYSLRYSSVLKSLTTFLWQFTDFVRCLLFLGYLDTAKTFYTFA